MLVLCQGKSLEIKERACPFPTIRFPNENRRSAPTPRL